MDTCYHEDPAVIVTSGIGTGSGASTGSSLSLNIPELEFKLGREGMSESSHGKHTFLFGWKMAIVPEYNSRVRLNVKKTFVDALFYIQHLDVIVRNIYFKFFSLSLVVRLSSPQF